MAANGIRTRARINKIVFYYQLWYGGFDPSLKGLLAWLFQLGIKLLRCALMVACIRRVVVIQQLLR